MRKIFCLELSGLNETKHVRPSGQSLAFNPEGNRIIFQKEPFIFGFSNSFFIFEKKFIMKKLFFFALVICAISVFTSCKKDYTCSCVVSTYDSDDNSTETITQSVTLNDTKKKAKDACNVKSATQTMGTITQTVTCTLK
jgi:hypothetical protein